jgi:hypothetical protein
MMTTLRSDRRTRRTAKFNLEYLDDRIVPSAIGAEAPVAAAVSTVHARAAEKATIISERHEARLARHEAKLARLEARHEAKLATLAAKHPVAILPLSSMTNSMNASVPASTVLASAAFSPTANPASPIPSNPATATNHAIAVSTDSSSSSNSTNPLPPNASAQLQSLYAQYEDFESSGGSGTFSPTGVNGLVINGTDVGINVHTNGASDFNTVLTQLQSAGLQVTEDSATYGLIDGMVPIAQLAAVAQISSGLSVTPMFQQMPG